MKLCAESIMSLQNDLTRVRGKRRCIFGIRDMSFKKEKKLNHDTLFFMYVYSEQQHNQDSLNPYWDRV